MTNTRKINGCTVIHTEGEANIIKHPLGYMLYLGGWRVGTYKTLTGAQRRIAREATR